VRFAWGVPRVAARYLMFPAGILLLAAHPAAAPVTAAALVPAPARPTAPAPARATAPAPSLLPATAPQSMRGFQVGEQRRYVLGPPEALRSGESAEWHITLHHIDGDAADRVAVFDLEYTRREPFGPLREPRVTRSLWAELSVNGAGFPLKVVVGERIEMGEIITDYVYEGGRYDKTIRWPETELSVDLRIPGHDADAPLQGVYAFLSQVPDPRFTGGRAFNDSIFANPGLLSLMLPLPLPLDDWEQDITLLTPGMMLIRYPTQEWIRQQRNAAVLRSYFDRNKLRLRDVEEVEIAGESVLARRFEIEGPFRGGYVDALGRVLLLEHDPGGGMERPQHIRMLGPSEY